MPYYDEPCPCPKCGKICILVIHANQERENTCPKCGFKFTDYSEQFHDNYFGLFADESEPGSSPFALFRDEDAMQGFLRFMREEATEEERDHLPLSPVDLRCSVYGSYWSSSGDDPWEKTFQPFIPEELERRYEDKIPSMEVTALSMEEQRELRMVPELLLEDATPVYFCEDTQRWYVFIELPNGEVTNASINAGPGTYAQVYLSGIVSSVVAVSRTTNSTSKFLKWGEYCDKGGTITLLPKEANSYGKPNTRT